MAFFCDQRCTLVRSVKTVSCSTQLNMKFQLLIKSKMVKIYMFIALRLSNVVFILLINVKMPTTVGILTLMSRINSMHAQLS